MSYIRSNRGDRNNKTRVYLTAATVVVCAVLLAMRVFAPDFSASFARAVSDPLWRLGHVFGLEYTNVSAHISGTEQLAKENRELRRKLDTYRARMLVYDIVSRENERMAAALGRGGRDHTRLVPAAILVKPPQSAYDMVIIDVGDEANVSEGDPVYAREMIYLGRVHNVNNKTSVVEMASSAGAETQAVLMPASLHLTVTGVGGGIVEARLPNDVEVTRGDRIITRGAAARVIGIVKAVDERPSDSFQTIRAQAPLNITALGWINVDREADRTEARNKTDI